MLIGLDLVEKIPGHSTKKTLLFFGLIVLIVLVASFIISSELIETEGVRGLVNSLLIKKIKNIPIMKTKVLNINRNGEKMLKKSVQKTIKMRAKAKQSEAKIMTETSFQWYTLINIDPRSSSFKQIKYVIIKIM